MHSNRFKAIAGDDLAPLSAKKGRIMGFRIVLASLLCLSFAAQAAKNQAASTMRVTESTEPSTHAANGIRFSLARPVMEAHLKVSGPFVTSTSGNAKIGKMWGGAIGYAYLPIRRLGFTAGFTIYDIERGTTLAKLDGNMAYTLNRFVYLKAGTNISGFTQEESRKIVDPSLGVQTSVGVQLTQNVGAEIGYLYMSQRGDERIDGQKYEFELYESGVDLALTATF